MARARLATELSTHTGRPRLRCTGCGKIAYATEAAALDAADRIRETRGQEMLVYLAKPCDWYHLSRAERDGPARFHPNPEELARPE